MRVTIPDDLIDVIATQTPPELIEAEIVRRVRLTQQLRVSEVPLLLTDVQLAEIAAHLGRQTSLRSYTDVLAAIDRLAGLSFGHLRFDFSAGQLEEMERRAARESMPAAEYAARVFRALTAQFFTTTPARDEWPQLQVDDPEDLSLGNLGIRDDDAVVL